MAFMAPLMLGTGATATAAATSGLIGTAGSFALPQFLMTAGGLMSGASAIGQGRATNEAAKMQASIYEQQAAHERKAAAIEESEYRDRQNRLLANARARAGAAGVGMEGSPLLVLSDFASEAEQQALKIGHGGELRATRMEQQAGMTRFTGRQEQMAGYMRAGASLLGSAGKAWGGKLDAKTT